MDSPRFAPHRRSPAEIERGIARLEDRILELQAFDISNVRGPRLPQLERLSAAIEDTLERCFGNGTPAYERLKAAVHLQSTMPSARNPDYFPNYVQKCIPRSLELLKEAQRTLREDLEDAQHEAAPIPVNVGQQPDVRSRRIFVVHGHDEGARETVARFLEKIGFEPVILHEKASQNRTVIEKIEAYHDVSFAVVLLTPDDEGCVKGGQPEPRARQNVLLELGYFMGRLGRENVCALKRGAVDIPSDFAGVVWVAMDAGNGWKQALGQELEAAGHEVDWNKVMRP
ncbi:nucleotide-binding protein [Caballeronia sp. GAFFF3]|uniref:TIR domain-containing protein n=1 Tax=Caballeronia sp. GAFFF3 TaxID=2921759 RepID=UPI002029039E|nr:nucleotide-binding protein [Caballeronia sp. GAFFF3]